MASARYCAAGHRAVGRLIYLVQQFNFLQIGRQKNLMYAVSVTFLALLYLALVRRVSTWLARKYRRKPRRQCSYSSW